MNIFIIAKNPKYWSFDLGFSFLFPWLCVCACVCTYMHMSVYTRVCMCVCVHVRARACMCVSVSGKCYWKSYNRVLSLPHGNDSLWDAFSIKVSQGSKGSLKFIYYIFLSILPTFSKGNILLKPFFIISKSIYMTRGFFLVFNLHLAEYISFVLSDQREQTVHLPWMKIDHNKYLFSLLFWQN